MNFIMNCMCRQFICLLLISSLKTIFSEQIVCNNTDIRNNVKDFYKLENCTRVEGYVQIVLIERETLDHLESLSFPNLTEITDYLLVYRVYKLRSLEKLFPNLTYIRGRHLFLDNALVINNVHDLERIGFKNIKHIKGGVRIERNSNLCFANTGDYELISKAVKATHSSTSSSMSRPKASNFTITVRPKSEKEIVVKWHSNLKQNITKIDGTISGAITHYEITITEIEDSIDLINQRNYCNNSSPFVGKLKADGYNGYKCDNKDKPLGFIFNHAEYEFEDEDTFIGNIIEAINVKKEAINNTIYGTKPKSQQSAKFSAVHQMKHSFKCEVDSNRTGIQLTKLKHFTPYFVKVSACHGNNGCTILGIKKTKTLRMGNADDINETLVRHSLINNSILIEWQEPEQPNGFITFYNIEYQELLNKTVVRICIDRYQYLLNNKSYRINNLTHSVKYSFKLRANSVAGPGNWSNYFNFTVPALDPIIGILVGNVEHNSVRIVYLTILLTIISCAFVLVAFIYYLRTPTKPKSPFTPDVISINPEYEKFIVDPDWEVKKSDIRLLNTLGKGAFGCVYAGELTLNNNQITKCAVKILNSNARSKERENFLKEANVMKSFVDCHHVVKLIGIVSIENPVLVLMEYMENGDLKTYLRSNRPDENPNACMPSLSRILQMAIEIADGMSYLASRKFVHRDLAARNCMVCADLTVKIGDFGMTRDIYDCDYYRKRDCGLIPVRWMSPESLRDGVFTTYSDVWSYGVVLWEMVTLGSLPYQGLSIESVYKYVISGGIMKEPKNCPKKVWKIISYCWKKTPKLRPTFSEIIEKLLPSANQRFRELCFHLNHKPFISKQQSLKKLWDNFSTPIKQVNRFLHYEDKQFDNYNEENNDLHVSHFPMNPTILSRVNKNNNEVINSQLKSLNQMNQIRNLKNNEENNENKMIKYLSNDNKESKLLNDEVISC